MSEGLADATNMLAEMLTAENAALRALDLPAVAALLARKLQAAEKFVQAHGTPSAVATPALRIAALRLAEEAQQNRRLLERALTVQTRVLGLITGAVRTAGPDSPYLRSGAYAARPLTGWALSARA